MEKLFSVFVGEERASGFCDIAVEVPLEVVYRILAEDCLHLTVDVFSYILAGHVNNALVSAEGAVSSGNMDAPVGMSAVQIGVGGYHFRLIPDTELQSESMNTVHKHAESALELVFVYVPVSERASVVVSYTEPAVVHNEHFYAKLLRAFSK